MFFGVFFRSWAILGPPWRQDGPKTPPRGLQEASWDQFGQILASNLMDFGPHVGGFWTQIGAFWVPSVIKLGCIIVVPLRNIFRLNQSINPTINHRNNQIPWDHG